MGDAWLHDCHVTPRDLGGRSLPGAGKANSEPGFGHGLDCDRGRSKGASRVRSAPITVVSGVLNRVGGVNLTEGGSKWLKET